MNTEHTKHPCEAVDASADVMNLAEMILSDCGCSTSISDSLQRRVAGRIQLHMDSVAQQLELERGTLLAETERKQQLQGQADALLAALGRIMQMDVKGHALQDRLQFSPAGRAILEQCQAAIAAAQPAAVKESLIAEPQAEPLTRDWPKIDAFMRDYAEGYEMIGDSNEVCYSPTKGEKELIIDCIRGLLAESDFIDMLTAQPTAQQQIVATQLVCDALVAIVSHSGDPAGTVAALAEWRKKAEAFTSNPAAQQQADPVSYDRALIIEMLNRYCECVDARTHESGAVISQMDLLAAATQPPAVAVPEAAVGKLRILLAACNRIEAGAEEFESQDGLEVAIAIDYWLEFIDSLEAARAMLAAAPKPTAEDSSAVPGNAAQDAARYRLLRLGRCWSVIDGLGAGLQGEELDAAVDVALGSAAQKGGEA